MNRKYFQEIVLENFHSLKKEEMSIKAKEALRNQIYWTRKECPLST